MSLLFGKVTVYLTDNQIIILLVFNRVVNNYLEYYALSIVTKISYKKPRFEGSAVLRLNYHDPRPNRKLFNKAG